MIQPLALCLSLVLARVATFVAVMPLLGGPQIPRLVKCGLAIALTLFWFVPLAEAMPPTEMLRQMGPTPWLSHGVALGREALLGALLGYALGLFLVPSQVAGEFLTQEMGLSFGNQVSAVGDGSVSPLTQMLELLTTALFFGLDGHHVFLGVLDATFTQYPINGPAGPLPVRHMVAGAACSEEWGLMLAGPVALCLFLTTVVLAMLARAAPQMNLYSLGFPLRLCVGLGATVLLLSGWVDAMVGAFGQFGALVTGLM